MEASTVRIDDKFRVVIPKRLRKKMRIPSNTELFIYAVDDLIFLRKIDADKVHILRSFERILKKAGAKRVAYPALQEFSAVMEDKLYAVAKEAAVLAKHAGRKTITAEDIRMAKRKIQHSDYGHVFVTRFWKTWSKDAVAGQFRKLCKKAKVSCYGFYRLRHCASTAMSLVATPHVHRKFMRHSQLQQQVTYTHTPDKEVDKAIISVKERLLG